jgi:hypothetical protein
VLLVVLQVPPSPKSSLSLLVSRSFRWELRLMVYLLLVSITNLLELQLDLLDSLSFFRSC